MGKRTITVVTCDLCESDEEEIEATTVRFGSGQRWYELDLCSGHGREVIEILDLYASKARPATSLGPSPDGARSARPSRRSAARPGPDRSQLAAVRRWATEQGMAVSARGRVPDRVMEAFQAAHGTPTPAPVSG